MNIRLHREGVTLDTDLLQTFKELEMKCLALWMYSRRRNWLSKTAEFLGGKSANELIHFLLSFAVFNPRGMHKKYSIHPAQLFLGTVNRAVGFQYSKQIFL